MRSNFSIRSAGSTRASMVASGDLNGPTSRSLLVRHPLLEGNFRLANILPSGIKIASATTAIYFAAQLVVSTDLVVNLLFSGAIFAGVAAVVVGGGLRSLIGLLNFAVLFKILLVSLTLKIIMWQPTESYLAAPYITPLVIFLGFWGLLTGTILFKLMPIRRAPLCLPVVGSRHLLALFWFTFLAGNVASLLGNYSSLGIMTDEGVRAGGILGISLMSQFMRDFSIAAALFYAYSIGSRLYLLHPLVLLSAVVAVIFGIASGSKNIMLNPFFFAALAIFLIEGWRQIRLYVVAGMLVVVMVFVAFPVAQYSRTINRTDVGFAERLSFYSGTIVAMIIDDNFRAAVQLAADSNNRENKYYGTDVGPVSRFAFIGFMDNLIAPTAFNQNFTGWYTVIWGVKMLPPRFLYADKPVMDSANYLSLEAGIADASTTGTPIAFGLMSCSYNAFGLPGAFFLTMLVAFGFYLWNRLFFGDAINANIWIVYVLGEWHNRWVETTLSGVIAGVWYAVIAYFSFRISILLCGGKRGDC